MEKILWVLRSQLIVPEMYLATTGEPMVGIPDELPAGSVFSDRELDWFRGQGNLVVLSPMNSMQQPDFEAVGYRSSRFRPYYVELQEDIVRVIAIGCRDNHEIFDPMGVKVSTYKEHTLERSVEVWRHSSDYLIV